MTKKQWILKFVYKHKFKFLCEFVCITIMTLVALFYPFMMGKIVNTVFYEKNMRAFLSLCLIYAAVFFFNQFIIATINNFMWSNLMTSFVFDIRRALFRKVFHKKGKDLASLYSGDMISRMNNDATAFMDLLFGSYIWGYANVLNITISLGFMFYYNLFLGLATLILTPIIFYTSLYFKKEVQHVSAKITKEKGVLSSFLFEVVKNLQEIKVIRASQYIINQYTRRTTAINQMSVESGKIQIKSERVNTFIALFAQLILFVICAYFIVCGNMALGSFVSALAYFNMSVNCFAAINTKIVDIGTQNVSIDRVVAILNEEEEDYKENIEKKEGHKGGIIFKNVAFDYGENGGAILKNIQLKIDGGMKVALVGKSGAGKTTLVNLIYNLYNVCAGEVLVDGINVNERNLHDLRASIGMVHQENILYNGTLRYSLSFSNATDNDEELIEALKKASLYNFFLTLKDGLDTIMGDEGIQLSGGQKQRLAIARIFVKNPQIMIFDEATAQLDNQNEELIQQALSEVAKDRTLILIAHRFSTIQSAEKIAVLADGVIKGFDSHENLMKDNETYRELFKEQFQEEALT